MREHESVTARFAEVLEGAYGLQVKEVREAPRGFAGETYFVETAAADVYFLKLMRNPRRQASFLHGRLSEHRPGG